MVPLIKLICPQKFFVKHTSIKLFAASVYVDSCLSLKMEECSWNPSSHPRF